MTTNKRTTTGSPQRVSKRYTSVDDVTEAPGEDFENWIKITKLKLKERESQYMATRVETLQKIINKQCKTFEKMNSMNKIQIITPSYDNIVIKDIINQCLNKLHYSIESWNGLNLSKTTKSLSTFRKYFVIGKCWFDKKKKNILAPEFWIKIFEVFEKFTRSAAINYVNEYKSKNHTSNTFIETYSIHLLLLIISAIFSGQLHFASTKPQPLIPCGMLKDSNSMKQYLLNVHPTLNIQLYINNNKHINAKDILQFVNKNLLNITKNSHNQFQKEFQKFTQINNNNNNNISIPNQISAICTPPIYNSPISPNQITNNNSSNAYSGTRSISQPSVIKQRYNPLRTYQWTRNNNINNNNNNNSANNYYNNQQRRMNSNNSILNPLNYFNNNIYIPSNNSHLNHNINRNVNMNVNLNNLNDVQLQLLYICLSLN